MGFTTRIQQFTLDTWGVGLLSHFFSCWQISFDTWGVGLLSHFFSC